jgi:hypothetical protein
MNELASARPDDTQSPITRTMSKAPSGYRFEHKVDIAGRRLIQWTMC